MRENIVQSSVKAELTEQELILTSGASGSGSADMFLAERTSLYLTVSRSGSRARLHGSI